MKILLATIAGGVIAFVWSAIVHMNFGDLGLSVMGEKEGAVLTVLKSSLDKPGLYFYPGMDMSKKMSKEEEEAWNVKYKAGPVGLLLYHPTGNEPMPPKKLIVEFVATAICAWIAALILSRTVGAWLCRATMVAMMGVFTWLAISVSQWNWFEFPFSFILIEAIDQAVGWFLAGLAIAKIVKPITVQSATTQPAGA
jgi:hypothetical protein